MSLPIQITRTWKGFSNLKYLVVFGDSYSEIYPFWNKNQPLIPTSEQPLGVPFPGIPFSDGPNWVGYLATTYNRAPLLILDFAISGVTSAQLGVEFDRFHVSHENEAVTWTPEETLFVTWIGINDVGMLPESYTSSFKDIISHHTRLYDLGARNFMFIDVPPIDRSPAEATKSRYDKWNDDLRPLIDDFAVSHTDCTVLLYSSWAIFSKILDQPDNYNLTNSDAKRAGGEIWIDHLHPTTKIHNIVAKDIAEFLSSVVSTAEQTTEKARPT